MKPQVIDAADAAALPCNAVPLPALTPREAMLNNRLRGFRAPASGEIAGQTVTLRWGAMLASPGDKRWFEVRLGEHQLWLGLEASALRGMSSMLPEAIHLADSAPALSALWLEYAWLNVVEWLEQRWALPLQIVPARRMPSSKDRGVVLHLEQGGHASTFELWLDCDQGAAWLDRLDAIWPPQARPAGKACLALTWLAGYQDLSFDELRSLAPGDVVMLVVPPQGSWLVLADWRVADAPAARAELLSDFEPIANQRGILMAEPSEPADTPEMASSVKQTTSLDDMPMRLTCRLGELEMTLAEVRQLEVGSVLSMARDVESAVELLINGRRVGRGSLLTIGDSLGVRIESLDLHD